VNLLSWCTSAWWRRELSSEMISSAPSEVGLHAMEQGSKDT
jgi:hypothetical protein